MDARQFRALGNKGLVVQQLVEQAAASLAERTGAALKAARRFALNKLSTDVEIEEPSGRFIRTSVVNTNTRLQIERRTAEILNATLPGIIAEISTQFNRVERLARRHAQETLKHFGKDLPQISTRCDQFVDRAKARARDAVAAFVAHVTGAYHDILFSRMSLGQTRNDAHNAIANIRGDRRAARQIAQELTQLFAACITVLAEDSELGGGTGPLFQHFGPKDERNVKDIVEVNPPGLIDPAWRGHGSVSFIGRVFVGFEWDLVSPNWREGWLHFNERGIFQPGEPGDPELEAKRQGDRRWMEGVLGIQLRETPRRDEGGTGGLSVGPTPKPPRKPSGGRKRSPKVDIKGVTDEQHQALKAMFKRIPKHLLPKGGLKIRGANLHGQPLAIQQNQEGWEFGAGVPRPVLLAQSRRMLFNRIADENTELRSSLSALRVPVPGNPQGRPVLDRGVRDDRERLQRVLEGFFTRDFSAVSPTPLELRLIRKWARENRVAFRVPRDIGLDVKVTGNVGLFHKGHMKGALAKVPAKVRQRVEDAGVRVVAATNVVDEMPGLTGAPRGWARGSSYKEVPGLFDPNSRVAITAENLQDRYTRQFYKHPDPAGTTLHEYGHALDHALGELTGFGASDRTKLFRDAYEKDLRRLRRRSDFEDVARRFGYFLDRANGGRQRSPRAARSEAFAQGFAAIYSKGVMGSESRVEFGEHFKATVAAIRQIVRAL